MTDAVTLRKAEIIDAQILADFNCAMALETENKTLDANVVLSGVQRMISEPQRGFYVVLIINNKVQASLMITFEWSDWRDADFWWIQSVYVAPEARRQGHYSRLYNEVKRMAIEADVCGIRLYAERQNHSAQSTYTSLGMHECEYTMFEESFT